MRALGHKFAGAVKDGFIGARILCLLGSYDRGNQVQSLDITVQETCVLEGNQRDRFLAVRNAVRAERNPELSGDPVLVTVGALLYGGIAARHLVVDKKLVIIHLAEQAL